MKTGRPKIRETKFGMIFNKLIIINKCADILMGDTDKRLNDAWLCLCICGNTCICLEDNIYSGVSVSCGCNKIKILKEKQTKYINKRDVSAHHRYNDYKRENKRSGFSLDNFIKYDDWYYLTQQNCSKCGKAPSTESNSFRKSQGHSDEDIEEGKFINNGVGRINNKIGHELSNCITRCKNCK